MEPVEEAVQAVSEAVKAVEMKRYGVTANKTMFISEQFNTAEEAIARATELVHEGFDIVSVRDNEGYEAW